MYPDIFLKENVTHGTRKHPITGMHFISGPGTSYPEHFFVERHWHSYVEILLIRKGSYFVEINLETYVLQEGDICILNSGDLHQITGRNRETIHEVVLFDPKMLDFSYADEWEEQYIGPYVDGTLMLKNIIYKAEGNSEIWSLAQELARRTIKKEEHWYVKCKLLILELFDAMTKQQKLLPIEHVCSAADARKVGRYKTIISYMEKHYSESISLQQLADTIPCNSQYLCRFFKEIAGVTPVQYLIAYRLERACELLKDSTKTVMEVALDCGFENISYFIRQFKAAKGCTPKEYRNQMNASDFQVGNEDINAL